MQVDGTMGSSTDESLIIFNSRDEKELQNRVSSLVASGAILSGVGNSMLGNGLWVPRDNGEADAYASMHWPLKVQEMLVDYRLATDISILLEVVPQIWS